MHPFSPNASEVELAEGRLAIDTLDRRWPDRGLSKSVICDRAPQVPAWLLIADRRADTLINR